MDRNKYNNLICNAVQNCTEEIASLMKERGLRMIDFVEHDIDLPTTTFENGSSGEYSFECIESIYLDSEENIILNGESGIQAYLDGNYGDFFNVADTIGALYAAVYDCFEKVDFGKSHFTEEEYEEKYSHGVTKDMWEAIILLLDLTPTDAAAIESMKITESDDKFDYIFIDFGGQRIGASYCVIRDKKNDDLYMPSENGGCYPASVKDIAMYAWIDKDNNKIMLNTDNEMEKYDSTTRQRLKYLNKNFPAIFDGISFVWHKNHTMCVKSKSDERNGGTKTSYVAIYRHHTDIVPVKLSKMEKLDVEFPALS